MTKNYQTVREKICTMVTQDGILSFLADDLGVDTSGIEADTPLFSSQIVDSFALVTLMMFLEREIGVRIAPTDVSLDNMDTVGRMLAYAARVSG
jgi:acyl carrier protein